MNILLYGPQGNANGMQTVNGQLARALRELGHTVMLGLPRGGISVLDQYRKKIEAETGCPAMTLDDRDFDHVFRNYDAIFVSCVGADLRKIIQAAAGRRVIILTHGLHVMQVLPWEAEYVKQPNVTYLCINQDHMNQAGMMGVTGVPFDLPVPAAPKAVELAEKYCVAVGTDRRKRLDRVAEIASALGMECRVYGKIPELQLTWLKYMGAVPHENLLEAVAGAAYLIHMADTEGRPMAVLEAIGLGVPVITPDAKLYDFLENAPGCIRIGPNRPPSNELKAFDLAGPKKIANRRALGKWAQGAYGPEKFKARLAEILGE